MMETRRLLEIFGNFISCSDKNAGICYVCNSVMLLFLLLCIISYLYMTCTRQGRFLSKFPGYRKFPIIGSLWVVVKGPQIVEYAVRKGVEKFGRRYVFWLGHRPYVLLLDADSVQKILSSPKFLTKGVDYHKFVWALGNGLITSNGQVWEEDKKLLNPFFKYQKLVGFLPIFNKYSKILVHILEKTFSGSDTNQELNLHPILCRATMDKINESALGKSSSFQFEPESKFLEAAQMILSIFRVQLVQPYLQLPIIWEFLGYGKKQRESKSIIAETAVEAIKSRREHFSINKNSETEATVFIDAFMESKTEAEIIDHVLTIFGAGFETTASGMNFTLFLLALNPEAQAKVHQEIDEIFGQEEEADRDVTLEDLRKLQYLEMCIKESLRLFPPAPAFIRKVSEDVSLDEHLTIPKGCNVSFVTYTLHRDPKHFPQPEEFIPERHLPEETAKRHPYAWIPFSAGPRNCIGQKYAMFQMKTTLVHILRKFSVSSSQKREDIGIIFGMVLEPSPQIKLRLVPRSHK